MAVLLCNDYANKNNQRPQRLAKKIDEKDMIENKPTKVEAAFEIQ